MAIRFPSLIEVADLVVMHITSTMGLSQCTRSNDNHNQGTRLECGHGIRWSGQHQHTTGALAPVIFFGNLIGLIQIKSLQK